MALESMSMHLPEKDHEYRQAIRLLDGNPLDRRILLALAGRPKRYRDLRPILDSQNDNALTRALARLMEAGLVDRRVDAAHDPPIQSYELNNLGLAVLLAMAEIRAVPRIAELAEAALGAAPEPEDATA